MAIFQLGDLVSQGSPWYSRERTGVIVRLSSHGPYCEVLWDRGNLDQHVPLGQIQVIQMTSNSTEVSDGD